MNVWVITQDMADHCRDAWQAGEVDATRLAKALDIDKEHLSEFKDWLSLVKPDLTKANWVPVEAESDHARKMARAFVRQMGECISMDRDQLVNFVFCTETIANPSRFQDGADMWRFSGALLDQEEEFSSAPGANEKAFHVIRSKANWWIEFDTKDVVLEAAIAPVNRVMAIVDDAFAGCALDKALETKQTAAVPKV